MSKAEAAFNKMWEELADRDEPPKDGPFYPGDICKIRGEAWLWRGDRWVHFSEAQSSSYRVQVAWP